MHGTCIHVPIQGSLRSDPVVLLRSRWRIFTWPGKPGQAPRTMIPLSTPLMHATLESSKLEPAKCVSAQAPVVFGSISGGLETHCFCLALGGVAEPGTPGEGGGRLLGCLAACGGCRDKTKRKEFGRHYLTRSLTNSSSTVDSG